METKRMVVCGIFSVQVPALDTIYTQDPAGTDIQWKLLAFIMSLKEDVITAIKAVPSEFQVISTTLYAMVTVRFTFDNFHYEQVICMV